MTYKPYYMKDVIDNSNKELFNVISTFAGGGGSSTGYRMAGGKILAVNEFVEAAIETYKENYPNTPVLPDDIKKLKGEDFLKIAGIKKGELDILVLVYKLFESLLVILYFHLVCLLLVLSKSYLLLQYA